MSKSYSASDIEVLSGLEPVRRRPGMYTDTSRPNHLAHEVIDNSVDEAMAGHCKSIAVVLYKDGSLEVVPTTGAACRSTSTRKKKIPGVELILTRLHAGGKFSSDNYQYSGGLHGVGVSVVNALSKNLEVWIKRGGKEYNLSFKGGKKGRQARGGGQGRSAQYRHHAPFLAGREVFRFGELFVSRLTHALRAKAVLCPGAADLLFRREDEGNKHEWCYEGGLEEYLLEELGKADTLPEEPFGGSFQGNSEEVDWALLWAGATEKSVAESYVNLIPTAQGGTHVNGCAAV